MAVRATGMKPSEALLSKGSLHSSVAHSAAINVSIKGAPALSEQPGAKEHVRAWLARLDDLETRLAEGNLQHVANETRADAVPLECLRRDRAALIEAIQSARRLYADRLR